MIEILRPRQGNRFTFALFDFDGTLSLIREGWQRIMIPYFTEELLRTPGAKDLPAGAPEQLAAGFITRLTGKQTIYQCIALAEEIAKLGGKAEDPQVYKDEYVRRLLIHIDGRIRALESGEADPESMTVPGSYALLTMLRERGVRLFLASGTDEEHVLREARLLKMDEWFGENIFGARKAYRTFSKKLVIERMIRENHLAGSSLLGFGDGYVEIENVREAGGYAVGVASDERLRRGIDAWKRERLIAAGADLIVGDYRETGRLETVLFDALR